MQMRWLAACRGGPVRECRDGREAGNGMNGGFASDRSVAAWHAWSRGAARMGFTGSIRTTPTERTDTAPGVSPD